VKAKDNALNEIVGEILPNSDILCRSLQRTDIDLEK
jgi:hypothetical protein